MSQETSSKKRKLDETAVGVRWRLDGYKVLVTGSTKGIGLATATEMASLGAWIFITARSKDDVQSTVANLQGLYPDQNISGFAADISTETGRAALLEAVSQDSMWEGCLDCLVNNAGTNVRKSIVEASSEEYSNIMKTNADSVWHLCKAVHPFLVKSSRPTVVNVSSAAGVSSTGSGSAYAMSKAAVIQLTKVLACEWAKDGIRVNCVAPWVTRTPLLAAALEKDPSSIVKAAKWTPLGRPGEPHEIASAVVFLAMHASSYVTGHVLNADGGLNANGFDGPCNE
mmetsp:Transcript_13322/g.22486  ORF Transcript_13322/g.22486 Transcript_13322/m.22486 type:complete len:284 (-) Transcript_13322:234-1085(-)|eukprot:CAMPEP_0198206314 /NCGR_PEP_ID=MMETSP1445-20131203/9850_1 /TAXON_ID=36898 /ORGANISM="Pyramimonas sp., Strain CCMP2087" /LENGTH=283 /DNA_ID=CAMNT_0043878967 /DNA_START=134 /DNA_END=985 /DNA_ORIENTATION=-